MGAVHGAGGVTVVAHPWGRHDHGPDGGAMDEAALAALRDAGLAGIEVDHQDHDPAARETLRAIARNLDLVVTGSSDYHGTGKVDHELGCNTTDPDDYARLLERAAAAAAASGRTHPGRGGRVSSMLDMVLLTEVFVTLFVIMDPPGTIPVFLSLTSGRSPATIREGRLAGGGGVVLRDRRRSRSSARGSCATCTSRSRPSRAPAGCCCSWSRWSC